VFLSSNEQGLIFDDDTCQFLHEAWPNTLLHLTPDEHGSHGSAQMRARDGVKAKVILP
jgi:hypothetical protein